MKYFKASTKQALCTILAAFDEEALNEIVNLIKRFLLEVQECKS